MSNFKAKIHQIRFSLGLRPSAPTDPLTLFKGPTSKRTEGEKRGKRKGGKGKEEGKGRGGERKEMGGCRGGEGVRVGRLRVEMERRKRVRTGGRK